MNQEILIKTTFSNWHSISKEKALEYAKYKINAITTGENDEERLVMINEKLKGIQFTLNDLKNE